MHDRDLTKPQLQWAIEQQQLVVEAADAKLRWAERMLTQARTERAAVEANNRADTALLDLEMAEERLRDLQHQILTVPATEPRTTAKRWRNPAPAQGSLFDVG